MKRQQGDCSYGSGSVASAICRMGCHLHRVPHSKMTQPSTYFEETDECYMIGDMPSSTLVSSLERVVWRQERVVLPVFA